MRVLPVFAWIGCTDATVAEAPVETRDGPFLVDSVVIDCDGSRSWTYEVGMQGRGDAVTVDVVAREAGALVWHEHHEVPEIAFDVDRALHRLELAQVTEPDEVIEGASTWFACEAKTSLTYGIAAWRFDGEMEECVAWGLDPEGEFPGCTSWGATGH